MCDECTVCVAGNEVYLYLENNRFSVKKGLSAPSILFHLKVFVKYFPFRNKMSILDLNVPPDLFLIVIIVCAHI